MATKLVVTAPLVIGKTSDGKDLYLYQGASAEGQSKEWRERHLRDELIGEREVQEREMPTGTPSGVAAPPPEVPAEDDAFLDQNADVIKAQASGVDEERRARLVELEVAGKNRTTVLAALRGE